MDETLAVALRDAARHTAHDSKDPPAYSWYLYEPRGKEWCLRQVKNNKTITQVFADTSIPGQVHRIYGDKDDVRELRGDELAEWAQRCYDRGLVAAQERIKRIEKSEATDAKSTSRPRGRRPRVA